MERDKPVRDECLRKNGTEKRREEKRREERRMSSLSSMFGCGVVMASPQALGIGKRSDGGLTIVCSSRPKKKATAHHMKTRPRKSQPWDINRKPTVYNPMPPLPPDWTLIIPADASSAPVAPPPPSA